MSPSETPNDGAHGEPPKPKDDGKSDNESEGMHSPPSASPPKNQPHTGKWQKTKGKARTTFSNIVWFFSDPSRALAFLTLLLVVLGFCTLWIQRDAEERQLRAYIGAAPDVITQNSNGGRSIQITAHNYGQTPARAVQINGGWELLEPNDGKEKISDRHFAYLRSEDSSGLDVFPAKDGTTNFPTFDEQLIAQMRGYSGPLKIYVAGIVTYEDIFGHLWETRYCVIISPKDFVEAADKPGTTITFDWCPERYNKST